MDDSVDVVSKKVETGARASMWELTLVSALPLILLGLCMQGMLKDGVTAWIPTFLEENFGLTFAAWINRKFFKNEVLAASVFFCAGFTALMQLIIFTGAYWVSLWESFSGETKGMDWSTSLLLYPCSIFLYPLPFMIWGHGVARRIAYGYISTLGLLCGHDVPQSQLLLCGALVGAVTALRSKPDRLHPR